MLLQDFLRKCDNDTKQIITDFFFVCDQFANRFREIATNVTIEMKNGNAFPTNYVIFTFLLMVCIKTNNDLKTLLKKHGLTWQFMMDELNFSPEVMEVFNQYLSKFQLTPLYKEKAFSDLWGCIIKAYCDNTKSIICMERILHNFIKSEKKDNRFFPYPLNMLNSDELSEDLLNSAESKENDLNYMSSSGQAHGRSKQLDIPFGNVLTNENFKYNPLVGRTEELRKMSAFLMDEEKSLIIYGSPGTGKTTLIKGLAYNIQNKKVPQALRGKEIIEVSASELISGCSYVGMVEERLLSIIKKLLQNENAILFIDEIHTLMGLGQGSHSNNDVSNILKPYLGDGRIKIVGATTTEEYKIIKNNGAFSRRFNNLYLPDLMDDEMFNLLLVMSDRFSENKQISINYDDAIKKELLITILNLSKRAIKELNLSKYNPDFALTLLRMCYNFAALDGRNFLDADYMIEGISNVDTLTDELKEDFKQDVHRLVKK